MVCCIISGLWTAGSLGVHVLPRNEWRYILNVHLETHYMLALRTLKIILYDTFQRKKLYVYFDILRRRFGMSGSLLASVQN